MPKRSTVPTPKLVPPGRAHVLQMPFDVGAFTLRPRTKLYALQFLLSQANVELEVNDDVLHGLSWIIEDIVDSLTPLTDDEGTR